MNIRLRDAEERAAAFALEQWDGSRQARWTFVGLLALLGAAYSILIHGFNPYDHNGFLHVPMMLARLDPALYPGDPFIAVATRYFSPVWSGAEWIARRTNLHTAFFIGYALCQFGFLLAVAACALRLTGNRLWTIVVVAFLAHRNAPPLGGGFYFTPTLTHTIASLPFLILAMMLAGEGRFRRAALLWGIGALIHLPNAVYLACPVGAAGAWWLWREAPSDRPRPWWAVVSAVVIGAVFFVPSYFSSAGGPPSPVPPLSYAELREFSNIYIHRHLFWSTFLSESEEVIQFVAQSVLAVVALWGCWMVGPSWRAWAAGLGALAIPAGVGVVANLIESAGLTRFMWLRIGDFAHVFGMVVLMAALGLSIAGRTRLHPALSFATLILVLVAAWRSSEAPVAWSLAAVVGVLAALLRTRPAMVGTTRLAVVAILACAVGFAAMGQRRWTTTNQRELRQQRPGGSRLAWTQTWQWARQHTPKDALFLSPPQINGWRFSERSTFVEARDCVSVVLTAEFAREFARRMSVFGLPVGRALMDEEALKAAHAGLRDEDLLRLARAEGIDFAVLDVKTTTSLPVRYANTHWKVVALPGAGS